MKIQIELNAKCRNCIHWEFETKDKYDFLEDDKTFCKLDNVLKLESEECELLELDLYNLKDNLKNAGFNRVKRINL